MPTENHRDADQTSKDIRAGSLYLSRCLWVKAFLAGCDVDKEIHLILKVMAVKDTIDKDYQPIRERLYGCPEPSENPHSEQDARFEGTLRRMVNDAFDGA